MSEPDNNPWIKVSNRLPEEADACDGNVLWGGLKNQPRATFVSQWDSPSSREICTHWQSIIPPPVESAPEEEERPAFEQWATENNFNIHRRGQGEYDYTNTHNTWRAWQARAKKGGVQ